MSIMQYPPRSGRDVSIFTRKSKQTGRHHVQRVETCFGTLSRALARVFTDLFNKQASRVTTCRTPSPAPSKHAPSAGTTLVELLLALAIAVLVITLLYSIYHVTRQSASSQQERYRERDPLHHAQDLIHMDLTCFFNAYKEDDACALTLEPDPVFPDLYQRLAFCALKKPVTQRDLRWATTQRIVYRVDTARAGQSARLREEQLPAGPPPSEGTSTNTLLERVSRCRMRCLAASRR